MSDLDDHDVIPLHPEQPDTVMTPPEVGSPLGAQRAAVIPRALIETEQLRQAKLGGTPYFDTPVEPEPTSEPAPAEPAPKPKPAKKAPAKPAKKAPKKATPKKK